MKIKNMLHENRVWRLKRAQNLTLPGYPPISMETGEEFRIVNEVLFMKGHIVMAEMQRPLIHWIRNNPKLFVDDTRVF